jgi:hypothetical protein
VPTAAKLVALGMARALVVAFVGAVGAVVVATALSPLAPLGEARTAVLSTGVTFDALVLLLGALGTVAVVLALGVWPAVLAARTLPSGNRGGGGVPARSGGWRSGRDARPAERADRRSPRPTGVPVVLAQKTTLRPLPRGQPAHVLAWRSGL